MTATHMHWTSRSIDDFQYRIAMDFVTQLEQKMDADGTNQKELADRLNVSVGRVSQVLNNPGRLNLKSIVKCARALKMKVAVVAYDDGDPLDIKGPVNSAIFSQSWKLAGQPRTFFDLENVEARPHPFFIVRVFNWRRDNSPTGVKARKVPGRWDEGSATEPNGGPIRQEKSGGVLYARV